MSDPQIVDALVLIKTSPCPGSGTGYFLKATVLSPGKDAPIISFGNFISLSLRLNHPVLIPENPPVGVPAPNEDLPLDETAILVDFLHLVHFIQRQLERD